MERKLEIRSAVVYIDSRRNRHNALVTNVFGAACCNVLFVVDDSLKTDNYGRQTERATSVVHLSQNEARANCWCWPDEVPTG